MGPTESPSADAEPSPARLLIHAVDNAVAKRGLLDRAARRLRALLPHRALHRADPPSSVRIVDLQGRAFFDCDDARSPIDVALPGGTYDVMVRSETFARCYTVTLRQGALANLYVHLSNADD